MGARLTRGWCWPHRCLKGVGEGGVLPGREPYHRSVKKKKKGGGQLTNADAWHAVVTRRGGEHWIWSLQTRSY